MQHFDPFSAPNASEREHQLHEHFAMMKSRGGTLDLAARTLTERENFFARLEADPVTAKRPVDSRAFDIQWRNPAKSSVDPRIDWIAAALRANEGETYGVELELERFAAIGQDRVDPHLLAVALEEHYHPKILAAMCSTFGIRVTLRRPGALTRFFTRCMNYLPTRFRMVFILAGEVVGTTLFRILLERCDLFADDPELHARLVKLVQEIIVDETGHVSFCRARVDASLLPVARWLAPKIAAGILRDIPEFARLAGSHEKVIQRVREAMPVPEAIQFLNLEATAQ